MFNNLRMNISSKKNVNQEIKIQTKTTKISGCLKDLVEPFNRLSFSVELFIYLNLIILLAQGIELEKKAYDSLLIDF